MIAGSAVCTATVLLGFLAFGKFDLSVLLGGLWGFFITVLNFFIMTLAIQKAMELEDEQQAKMKIHGSYTLRMLLLVALMIVGVVLPWMHWGPILLSVFYPRIVITARGAIMSLKNRGSKTPAASASHSDEETPFQEEEKEDAFEKAVGFFGARAARGITELTDKKADSARNGEDDGSST